MGPENPIPNSYSTPPRTVLITGAAKGIGRAFSEKLAAEGWSLLLCGRDVQALQAVAEDLKRRFKVTAAIFSVDLALEGAPRSLFNDFLAQRPLPDAMICNAADYGTLGMLKDVAFRDWKRSFDLNFFSVAEMVQLYIRRATQEPSIRRRKILLMSGGGLGGSKVLPAMSAYSCAKAAIYRLVEVVNEEAGALGIDINCLAPGAVKTGFTDQARQAAERQGAQALGALHDENQRVLQTGGESPLLAAKTAALLLSERLDGVSGRLVSAKWDGHHLAEPHTVAVHQDLLRLRRIDGELFKG